MRIKVELKETYCCGYPTLECQWVDPRFLQHLAEHSLLLELEMELEDATKLYREDREQ
jgi:hypothetical protein